jgi:CheY-like chemotaxis protein
MANLYMIEDDMDYANVVAKVVKSMGHTIEIESDTVRALERLKHKQPDLIILDVMFPEDGFAGMEFARTLKNQSPEVKNIPILLLTSVNEKQSMNFTTLDIDNSFLPIADFLDKSVDLDILKSRITKLLETSSKQAR